jgi:hypothetical protein
MLTILGMLIMKRNMSIKRVDENRHFERIQIAKSAHINFVKKEQNNTLLPS